MNNEATLVGVLIKDIDVALQEATYFSGRGDTPKTILAVTLSPKLGALFEKLIEADEQCYQATLKFRKIRDQFIKSLPEGKIELGFKPDTKRKCWNTLYLKEGYEAMFERTEGSRKQRAERRRKLRELRDKVVKAAATGDSLLSYVEEFQKLRKV